MAKTFLLKSVVLSCEIIEQLEKDFNLSDDDISNIQFWNESSSPWNGTIIDTEEKRQYNVYPSDGSKEEFIDIFPTGII